MLRRLLAAAALAGLAIVVAGGLYAAAFAFQASSAEYGLHRGADARAWSLRPRSIRHPVESTEDAVCLSCHALGRGEVDVTAGDRP